MKLKIGNHEATQLRSRLANLGLTQKQLAEKLGVSERYIREILSINKTKSIGVDQEKIETLLALLGVSSAYVFPPQTTPPLEDNPHLASYVQKLKSRMYNILSKDSPEVSQNQQLAHFLQKDNAVNKTMGFWHTLIVKTIADKYKVMRHFFNENDFFNIIPKTGYWRKFQHDASVQKNCYFSFKLIPSRPNSVFKIAYTLESPLNISPLIPRKIKIIFGKIECRNEYILVTQFHDTPGSYKIKAADEITVTTWLDEANHDFLVFCDDDFTLLTANDTAAGSDCLGVKTKREVRDMFHRLDTVLFPRNHIFHRTGRHDMGDDPIFFWNNRQFLTRNADLLDALLDDAPVISKEGN